MSPSSSTTRSVELRECFADPLLDVMNFLNEAVLDFSDAISFAPGRPLESLFDVEDQLTAVSRFVADAARRAGCSAAAEWRKLGQYSRTNGFVAEVIAGQLARDEGIHVDPSAIIVTVGAQEAMAIALIGLFDPRRDILLVSDPTYIGITGTARLLGIRVIPVASGADGLDAAVVEETIKRAARQGRVRALYDVPDFNNPMGTRLPLANRMKLLEVCERHGVLVLEDNPYGMFAYDCPPAPTLKALDTVGNVLYIGSYAKTLFPGLRIGYLVADQQVGGTRQSLAAALSRVKSQVTVNTPPLSQAILAAVLQDANGSLERLVAPKRAAYKRNRDAMLASLTDDFGAVAGVSWTRPDGGFFLPVTLPFEFGAQQLRQCAADYGVIVCPMQFFCIEADRRTQIRLSFSYVQPVQIAAGVERLKAFVVAQGGAGSRASASVPAAH